MGFIIRINGPIMFNSWAFGLVSSLSPRCSSYRNHLVALLRSVGNRLMWLSRAVPVRYLMWPQLSTPHQTDQSVGLRCALSIRASGCKGVTPWQELRYVLMELEFYEEMLSHRSSLIVTNKIGENGADERLEEPEIDESEMSEDISGFEEGVC